MPPHMSHLLQPLDVGCFSPLKAAYRQQVQEFATAMSKATEGISVLSDRSYATNLSTIYVIVVLWSCCVETSRDFRGAGLTATGSGH